MDTARYETIASDESDSVIIEDVSYLFSTYTTQNRVLRNIDLAIGHGEFVILTGPSGAGKTTLLTLIGALRKPQSGAIRTLGSDLSGLSNDGLRRLRRRIGFIFQDHNLFEALTPAQTLRLTLELGGASVSTAEALGRAESLLAQIGMDGHLHARTRTLSTGQKQRIAIARALINDPPLVLADEPTASIDRASADAVLKLLRARVSQGGTTVLMVTHDERIFSLADRVITMVDGRVVEMR